MAEEGWKHYREISVDDSFVYGTRYGVSDAFGAENLRTSVIQFDPGEEGPLSYHHEPIEEFYVVLDGKLDVQIEEELVEADEGTVLFIPPGTSHAPRNPYDEPATLLTMVAPDLPMGEYSSESDLDEIR